MAAFTLHRRPVRNVLVVASVLVLSAVLAALSVHWSSSSKPQAEAFTLHRFAGLQSHYPNFALGSVASSSTQSPGPGTLTDPCTALAHLTGTFCETDAVMLPFDWNGMSTSINVTVPTSTQLTDSTGNAISDLSSSMMCKILVYKSTGNANNESGTLQFATSTATYNATNRLITVTVPTGIAGAGAGAGAVPSDASVYLSFITRAGTQIKQRARRTAPVTA